MKRRDFMKLGAGAMSLGLLAPAAKIATSLVASSTEIGAATLHDIPAVGGDIPDRRPKVVAEPAPRVERVPVTASRPSGIVPPSEPLHEWELLWVDDFVGGALPSRWKAYEGSPSHGGYLSPTHVKVRESQLILQTYQDLRYGGQWTSAGVSTLPKGVQTYGKYEICYRIEPGEGVSHCLLLWPPSPATGPPEIDFAEDSGHGRSWVQGTLHWRDPGGRTDQLGTVLDIDTTQWHVLGVEWRPELLQFTVDGVIWKTIQGPHVSTAPMGLCMQTQTWGAGTHWGAPDPKKGTWVNLYVDWAAVYRYKG